MATVVVTAAEGACCTHCVPGTALSVSRAWVHLILMLSCEAPPFCQEENGDTGGHRMAGANRQALTAGHCDAGCGGPMRASEDCAS